MATNEKTIKSLERIKDAIKVLRGELNDLSRHIAQQKRQPAWKEENGKWHHVHKSIKVKQ